jgi:hypothetical protein
MDTSLEDQENSKAAKFEDDAPAWAKALMAQSNEILGVVSALSNSVAALELKIDNNKEDIDMLKTEVALNTEKVEDLQDKNGDNDDVIDQLRGEVRELQNDIQELKAEVIGLTDGSLRDHLTFHGIPRVQQGEKTWENTTELLAKWLADNMDKGKDFAYYDAHIERAHRGPRNPEKPGPAPIFCKMWWRTAESIRHSLRDKHNGVQIKDKYHAKTQTRRNNAMLHRQEIRKNSPTTKCHVAYPARVMVKHTNEERYKEVKAF